MPRLALEHAAQLREVCEILDAIEAFRRRADGGQRISQLVAEHGQKLVLRAVRRLRARQRSRALLLELSLEADVAGDLRRADDPSARVADR
ncbi:hypothetical protein D3C83_74500 [compost metagenome]